MIISTPSCFTPFEDRPVFATALTLTGALPGFWRVESETLPFVLIGVSLALIFVLMFKRKSPW